MTYPIALPRQQLRDEAERCAGCLGLFDAETAAEVPDGRDVRHLHAWCWVARVQLLIETRARQGCTVPLGPEDEQRARAELRRWLPIATRERRRRAERRERDRIIRERVMHELVGLQARVEDSC